MEEVVSLHTGLLRLGLAVEHSVRFWTRARTDSPLSELREAAWREKWFDDLSKSRVHYLVGQLGKRFPFPARELLDFSPRAEHRSNALVCHWHLLLSDPLYRAFASEFLFGRWAVTDASVDLATTREWLKSRPLTADWQPTTLGRMASGLLSAATEAGLCEGRGSTGKTLRLPTVDRDDIKYLHRMLSLAGAVHQFKTYLMSVGQTVDSWEEVTT